MTASDLLSLLQQRLPAFIDARVFLAGVALVGAAVLTPQRWKDRFEEAVRDAVAALRERLPRHAPREAMAVWGLCFGAILVTHLIAPGYAKLTATLGFIYLPLWASARRGEDYAEYGITLRAWKKDLLWFGVLFAAIAFIYVPAQLGYMELLLRLPSGLSRHLAPFIEQGHFQPRLPDRFAEWCIDQLFVVALPEEFFYRGYLLTRLRDGWPQGRVFLGVRLGPAFWLTAALFALGHLAVFEFWRLAVFFPALLFAWLRQKTGTVMGAALLHACCNLLVLVVDASFYRA